MKGEGLGSRLHLTKQFYDSMKKSQDLPHPMSVNDLLVSLFVSKASSNKIQVNTLPDLPSFPFPPPFCKQLSNARNQLGSIQNGRVEEKECSAYEVDGRTQRLGVCGGFCQE